jgi:hypothetical protein
MGKVLRNTLAGLVAAATLLSGGLCGLFVSSAAAAGAEAGTPYGTVDDFESGPVQTKKPVNLTVIKSKSADKGGTDTGAQDQRDNTNTSTEPESGIRFILRQVTPKVTNGKVVATGKTPPTTQAGWETLWHTVDPDDPDTYDVKVTYYGTTDNTGTINLWYLNKEQTRPVIYLPAGHKLYVLMEDPTTVPSTVTRTANSVFDMPYRTTNTVGGVKKAGFVYNLHVYPKDVSNKDLNKMLVSVQKITGSGSSITTKPVDRRLVQVGDVLTYDISQKIYDTYTAASLATGNSYANDDEAAKDGHLTFDKIATNNTANASTLKIADRLSSALTPWNVSTNADSSSNLDNASSVWLTYYDGDGNLKKVQQGQFVVLEGDTSTTTIGNLFYPRSSGITNTDPGRLSESSTPLFGLGAKQAPQGPVATSDGVGGNGTRYAQWTLFKNVPDAQVAGLRKYLTTQKARDLVVHVRLTAKVTPDGDSVGNLDGRLTNDAASDVQGATAVQRDSSSATSAGFMFGKTLADSKTPAEGAQFRLIRASGSSGSAGSDSSAREYLGSDGAFHSQKWYASSGANGVKPITAVSNNRGTVAFAGIPITNADRSAWNTNLLASDGVDVVEYLPPAKTYNNGKEFSVPSMPFAHISWSKLTGTAASPKKIATVLGGLSTDSRLLPDGWPTEANSAGKYVLDFGGWSVDHSVYDAAQTGSDGKKHTAVTAITGEDVYPALKNYVRGQEPPIHLPLTGGLGIILLLVVGAAIMAIVVIESRRRKAAAAKPQTPARSR